MTMKRSFVFAGPDSTEDLLVLASEAESAGFFRVWTTETPTRDAILRAAAIAVHTTTIQIGTGIAYAFTRSPLTTAAAAAEVQALSRGRFTLGLGSMTRGMRSHWYGLELDHPAPRLKEYVRFVRAAHGARKSFRFNGGYYRAEIAEFQPAEDVLAPPIYGSGVNATMLRSCLDVCDGVALHPLIASLPHLDRVVLPAAGAARHGVSLAAWRITAVDENPESARQAARAAIAFYLTTPSYRSAGFERPWLARGDAIQRAFRASTSPIPWASLGALVSDEMLDELAIAGTPAEAQRQAAAYEAELARRGVDELVLQPASLVGSPGWQPAHQRLIIRTLAPDPAA
jgi:alkanesulfonate monooxygenase SsuD/methylene tetrahydromethanopterin reductase-like flavin-dependent oxidoreductase (luciferase family)